METLRRDISISFMIISVFLPGCVAFSPLPSNLSSNVRAATLVRSFEQREFFIDLSSGQFVNRSKETLVDTLLKLNNSDVSAVKLSPYSEKAHQLLKRRLQSDQRLSHLSFELTAGKVTPILSLSALGLRGERLAVRYQDCSSGSGVWNTGCSTAVNRAMSLRSPQEIESAQPLSPAAGWYEQNYLVNVRTGRTASLPDRKK